MDVTSIVYRLYRLRRLALAAIAAPVLAVLLIAAFKGSAAFFLLPIAVVGPLMHLVAYPRTSAETIAISLTVAVLLLLAGTISPQVSLVGIVLRLLGLMVLAFILFLILSTAVPSWLSSGNRVEFVARAKRRSRLEAEVLRKAITYYPGREDERVSCGAITDQGVFPITLKHRADGIMGEEPLEMTFFGKVVTDEPGVHEMITITDDGEESSVTHYEFRPRRRGSVVELVERSVPMPRGQVIMFWLEDYMADFLKDEVDRAEGRPAIANRAQPQSQFIVDLARAFMSRIGRDPTAQ